MSDALRFLAARGFLIEVVEEGDKTLFWFEGRETDSFNILAVAYMLGMERPEKGA
ncbi:hypothetical protein [Methylobacterium segetis]|uniref:hypothetical protein n=1 Tax=Methylobacterium segetis TaxID=2488750 RepID=UPI0014054CE3|nr:hypothetical protein [Methylobacterium segetis]